MTAPFPPAIVAAAKPRLPWDRKILAPTGSRLDRAVEFMIGHDTTVRKAAAVFGVDPRQLVEAFNAKTGAKRVLVEGGLTW